MNTRARMGWTVVVAVVAAGGWWWQGRGGSGEAGPAGKAGAAPHSQAVTLVTVRQQDMPVQAEAAGTVVPLNTVEVRPQVSTTVRSVAIQEGQFVHQGDLLFTLDDRSDQANLEKARATLLRDQATLADLERQWRRNQELLAQNFVSQGALDSVQAQRDAQVALVASDKAAVRAAEVSAGYNTVRAPLSGRAGAIAVHPGSLVSPTGDPLVTISQIDPIGVSFTLPEAQLPTLLGDGDGPQQQRTPLGVTVLRKAADGGEAAPMTGQLSFLDNTVDSTSGTIKLKARLANPAQALWPGQYVTVRLTLRTLKDAAVLPQAALIIKGDDREVYVVGADQKADLRPVKVLNNDGAWAAVSGVKPGEQVVMEGKENLRPGGSVHVAPTAAPASAASSAGSAPTRAGAGA
ncbi:efflux RND transporter periplasmic adaptor subunit [Ideonella dechloratans]|uniref:Efflux RND transporter periplasmic adaptor subunit n=1 Tax=Ideonella dechloratans TaxID=36863 RepID=A0A643FIH9_IDEDE|nr:efflux RND transporter periplasmic adaptor subunit [Ideonella dechloratans]KAB0584500.1 efflux RND transporter periplasmic adaptor subunit [Ideonella dechloratans]UFU10207.1 efflux RND transporter periplasmic adaptor subunit [Ideonella dechloratans]